MRYLMLLLGVHFSKGLGVALGYENGVPAEVGVTPRLKSDFPLTPTCEELGLCLRRLTVGINALGIG